MKIDIVHTVKDWIMYWIVILRLKRDIDMNIYHFQYENSFI